MDYSGLTAFHLSWLYMTVRLAAKLLSNKSDIGEAVFGRRPTLVAYTGLFRGSVARLPTVRSACC